MGRGRSDCGGLVEGTRITGCLTRCAVLAAVFCSGLLLLPVRALAASINACGGISTDTTWLAANVYVINNCSAVVAPGVTLTIQPGTVVKFGGGSDVLLVQGTLMAQGTSGSTIAFTSLSDDSRGGDTNSDGASQGQPGRWSGLRFAFGSHGRLAYVFVGFGGSGAYDYAGRYGAAELESFSSDVTLDHVTLQASGNSGLYADNASVQVTYATVSNNAGYGLYWNGVDGAVPLLVSDTNFTGNGAAGWLHFRDAPGTITFQRNVATGAKNGFQMDGRLNQGSLLWDNAGNLPLVISPGAQIAPATTLTLRPGTVVKVSGGTSTLDIQGVLQSQGTADQPVAFTSFNDDSRVGDTNGDGASTGAPGQWASVRFESGSQGRLAYTSFEYGGSGAYDYAGRYGAAMFESFSSDVTLDHVTLRASNNSGLYADSASVQVSDCQVKDNAAYGLYWNGVDAAVPLAVSDTTFSGNGTAAGWIHFRDTAGTVTFGHNTATGPRNGFRADGRLKQGSLTWDNEDDLPLLINGGLTIAPATTLTLDPGTIVKFGNSVDVLLVQGTLQAVGNAGNPIVLTSVSDDEHGGDTNGDGPSRGQPGQWSGLRFVSGSTGRLAHAFIGYGGSGAYDYAGRYGVGMVESFSADVILDWCTLHASAKDGLYAENATVEFTNGAVSDNARYGLNYNGLDAAVPLVVSGNAFSGSQGGAMRLDLHGNPSQVTFQNNTGGGSQRRGFSLAGTIASNTVWDNTGSLPLVIDGGLTVATGATLTLRPGTVIKLAGGRDVLFVQGGLTALGTESAPITLTSLRDDTHGGDTNGDGASTGAVGDWSGLRFAAGSTGRLAYTFLGFGGSGDYDYAGRYGAGMLESFSTDVTLDHCTLQSSEQNGLYAFNTSVGVTNSQFTGNLGNGAYYDGIDSVTPLVLRANTFSGNGAYGAYLRLAESTAQINVEDNQAVAPKNGLRLSGRVAQGLLSWDNPNAPMVIDGGLGIRAGAGLTLEPGTVVKFAGGSDVLQIEGTLTAEGTFTAPIAFTSFSDDAHGGDTNGNGASAGSRGQWSGLRFLAGSQVSLRHSFVGYGASGAYDHLGYYGRGLVDVRGGRVQVKFGEVRSSAIHGVYVENAAVQIAYAAITDHAQNAIMNATPAADVDARHNWWGAASGPKHPTLNPGGTGGTVSDGVAFAPWVDRFTWLDPTTMFVHGVAALSWTAFDVDPASLTSDAQATGSAGTQNFGSGFPAGGAVEWDTRPLPNGHYELRASWRDLTATPVNEAVRAVIVNNDPTIVWHGGRLTADETWSTGHVHVVEDDVIVNPGVRLTIQPGTIVKFTPGTRLIVEDGGIVDAPATEVAPIVFTSIADDVSGDTNLDGTQGVPRPGDWNGVVTRGAGQFNDNPFVDVRYTKTEHSGLLSADERWRGSFVHHLTGDVTVPTGVTLTIDAGAVVKFDAFKGIVVQPGGHLVALGTVAEPIVLTSVRDDTAGGDTNSDGDSTVAAPGDWRWIYVDGTDATATFDHVDMRYGGGTSSGSWDQTGMIRTNGSASLTVTNSILHDVLFDGILAWGGTVDIRSSIFTNIDRAISAHPGSPVHVVNCSVDGNRIGLLVHGGTMDVTNTVVSNNHDSGIQYDFGTLASVRYSDVWAATGSGSVNYRGTSDQTGSNGNISLDPHYVDREHGNYRLDYRSPAIDAADGPAAPATDIGGVPRYDDPRTPNTGIPTSGGAYADMGAYEFAETADSNLDLIVSGVSGPTVAVAGERVRIQWTIINIGSAEVVGPWHDTVNLVLSPDANPTVIFAGEVLVGESVRLGPGQSVSTAAEIRVPGSIVAEHRWQVVTNTRGEVFEGHNRENNTGLSLTAVTVDLPELIIGGAALSRQFDGVGQAHWFKFVPSAGQDVIVRLDRAGSGGSSELYIAQGYMPSRERFDARHNELNAPDVSTLAASTSTQTYHVLAYPASLPAGGAVFTISARALDFSLDAVGPQQVGNAGTVTLTLHGGQLRSGMTFEIVDAHGSVHGAQAVFIANSSVAYVTFDLSGLPLGTYTVRVRDGAATATLTDGINVIAGTPGSVQAHLTMPKAMRPDWTEPVTVDYVNVGNTDVVAPLMVLSMENAKLRLPGKTDFAYPTVQLLGINSEGPAGILPPGAHGTITLEIQPTASGGTITGKLWVLSDPNRPWDWNAVKAIMRPDFVAADAWEAIYANFTGKVGTTVGQYDAVLAADATYLSQLGEYTADVQRLLAFELNQAGLNELTRRYTLGAFGRGAPAWWEAKTSSDVAGDVTIGVGSALRFFMRQADGSYRSVPGDRGTLTLENGAYRVHEAIGIVAAFQPNGAFDYVEDRLGRRVTATYSGNRVTGLADDTGDTVVYTYNPQGRISQITDPVGRVTTLTYDATGELLAAVAGAQGTTSFTYDNGQEPATWYALRSITFPDATHSFYDYDSRGRLVHTSGDGGAEARGYAYDAAGGVTVTDATGSRVVALANDTGQVARLVDALSNGAAFTYDDQHRPTRLDGPGGARVSFQYDPRGNVAGVVDPMSQQIAMAYEPTFNQLTALTNAAGHTIQYERDAQGNVTGTTYPNGDQEHFAYDQAGNTTAWTNGRARTVHNTYDAHQLLTRQDLPDGSHREFTYDARRNLTAATDASGTAHLAYDSADRLTQITYPSGRFLQFAYDAGGRRSRSVDQGGFTVNYAYDTVGRLASLTDGTNAPIVAYTYNTAGQLTRKDLGNGTYTTYEYDLNGQVLHLNNRRADSTVLSRFDYTYDSLGRRTGMVTRDGQWVYTYDASGQLTHAVFNSTNPAIANQDLTYEYDAAGNRVRTVHNGTSVTYATNSADQYVTVGTSGYAYDADGNLISRGDDATQWTYTYDDEDQLSGVTGPDGSWTYEYDVFGNRVAATHDGQRTEYLVDPAGLGNVVGTYDGAGALTARYVHGAGLASRVDAAGGAAYFAFDALGNASEITDPNGIVLNQYAYRPFGERMSASESIENSFTFVGEFGVEEEATGLYFMRARFYAPKIGRFLQRDPLGITGGANLYAYVGNDPVNAIDPLGLTAIDVLVQSPLTLTEMVDLRKYLMSLTKQSLAWDQYLQAIRRMSDSAKATAIRRGGIRALDVRLVKYLDALREYEAVTANVVRAASGKTTQKVVSSGASGLLRRALPYAGRAIAVIGAAYTAWELGTSIGGWLREIPGLDEGVQSIFTSVNDRLGGWLFGTPPEAELGFPIVTSHDPNDLIGPSGNGTAHWIAPDQTLPYKIRFENDKQATAPAQVVRITTQLDPDLDYATFELGSFNFDGVVITVPAGRQHYKERLDLRSTHGLYLDISGNLDFDTGIVTWVFASVDPVTGTTPRDPLTGFLPPNVTSPIGEGYVTYTVRSRSSSGIGTPISAQASIVFDTNEPIDTPRHQNPVGPIADCTGDCNSSNSVTVDELLTMVNIALGNVAAQACVAGDLNGDGTVTIDEILTAVNHALNGCPAGASAAPAGYAMRVPPAASPTPTPSATPTPTATPVEGARMASTN